MNFKIFKIHKIRIFDVQG